jgi:hypothetical protein
MSADPRSLEVLEQVLGEVRRTRRRRQGRRLLVLPLLLLGGAWWGLERGDPPGREPLEIAGNPRLSEPVAGPTLTVVEWSNGSPSLVEYSGEALGRLELSFSLEPVVAFPVEIW